jgi:hypothetical protein
MTDHRILDEGEIDFGFVDQKGRACGYRWTIQPHTHYQTGRAMVRLHGGPTRRRPTARTASLYGPAHHVDVETLEQARQLAAKRVENSRKRDAKKFTHKETA